MACINCGEAASEKFCPLCGQRTGVKRITLKEGWFDFWSRIYGFDGMFPRTMRDLTLRPGKAAVDYIHGNRVKYYGPVGYFFLMITFYLLLLSFLNINIIDFIQENQGQFSMLSKPGSGQDQVRLAVTSIVADYIKILFFTIIFFQALAARYFFFRKSSLNLLEHFVLPLYVVGHGYWLNMVGAIVFKLTGTFMTNVTVGVMLVYFGYAYSTFIDYQPKWKSFFKGLGIFLGGYALMAVVFIAIAILVVALLVYFNPDALELIKPSNNP